MNCKLGEINDQLSTLSSDPDQPPSQSMLRAIQRHRDVYQDYVRELRRTKVRAWINGGVNCIHHDYSLKTNVQHALDQANLLSGVRNDIE